MSQLSRLLDRFPPSANEVLRCLQFYQLMVEIERLNEPVVKNWHSLAKIPASLSIPFSDKGFAAAWQGNVQQPFPRDLSVSLMVSEGVREHPLFVLTFPYLEMRSLDLSDASGALPVPLASLSVNLSVADNLELDDTQLQLLSASLSDPAANLTTLSKRVSEVVGARFTISSNPLRYALSSGKPVTNSMVAELRVLSRMQILPEILQGFLDNRAFGNKLRACRPDELVCLSDMDDAQRQAVANALNSRVSVITGPPGCGKTQVLLNILGNAVVQNLSVLVASTNNKAVDNVCERLCAVRGLGEAIVRFGSKEICTVKTVPQLDRLSGIADKLKTCGPACQRRLGECSKRHAEATKRCKTARNLKRERDDLLKALGKGGPVQLLLKEVDICGKELDGYVLSARRLHNEFSGKYVFIRKLWINWFTLRKHAAVAVETFLKLPACIRNYLDGLLPCAAAEQFKSGSDILRYYRAIEDGLTTVGKAIRVNEINSQDPDGQIETAEHEIDENSPGYVRAALDVRLATDGAAAAIRDFKSCMTGEDVARKFLGVSPLLAVTSLSAKNSLPLSTELVDLLVIDEASQCDVASALPLVYRAKQIVIIGDPKQLTHITSVKPEDEKLVVRHLNLTDAVNLGFSQVSLWDHTRSWLAHADANAEPMFLSGHYRCHPDIISYSNNFFYGGQLLVRTVRPAGNAEGQGCAWIDVRGQMLPDEHTNTVEADAVCDKVKELMALYPSRSLGVITPYNAQSELIYRKLQADASVDTTKLVISTVHKFQGDERDMIIYDLVLSDGARDGQLRWVDETVSNLVNVAVTRARRLLCVVGNARFVEQKSSIKSPLGALLRHIKNRGGLPTK